MSNLRRAIALTVLASLAMALVPSATLAAPGGGRIEGVVHGPDGRPVSGYEIVLVDPGSGDELATAPTAADGLYSFRDLPAGSYAMAVRRPEGGVAPVAAEPVQLAGAQLARRDMALVEADSGTVDAAAQNHGLVLWWVSRSRSEKVWTVVAVVGAIAAIVLLLEDDDDDPATASAFTP